MKTSAFTAVSALCKILVVPLMLLAPFCSFAQDPYFAKVPALPAHAFTGIAEVPVARLELLEAALFARANALRIANGVTPLFTSDLLLAEARSHSQDMAIHHYFAHEGKLLGDAPVDRIHMASICGVAKDCPISAENVSNTNFGSAANVLQLFSHDSDVETYVAMTLEGENGFMSDAAHRMNMLRPQFESMAFGVALSDDGVLYITQDFIRSTPLPVAATLPKH